METKRKVGRPKGHKLSDESKAKISASKTGYKHDEATKKKITESVLNYYESIGYEKKTNETICEGCGKVFISKNKYIPRHFCDVCLPIMMNNKGGTYKKARGKIQRKKPYREWREKVLARDNHTCVMCNKKGNSVHHLIDLLEIIDKPEVLYDVNVGVTICRKCHNKIHWEEKLEKCAATIE